MVESVMARFFPGNGGIGVGPPLRGRKEVDPVDFLETKDLLGGRGPQ